MLNQYEIKVSPNPEPNLVTIRGNFSMFQYDVSKLDAFRVDAVIHEGKPTIVISFSHHKIYHEDAVARVLEVFYTAEPVRFPKEECLTLLREVVEKSKNLTPSGRKLLKDMETCESPRAWWQLW